MNNTTYGHTGSGTPITDELIEKLADQAEHGFDVDDLITQRVRTGRPRLGSEPSTVESFRLDPSLKAQLDARAAETGLSTSEVIRIALRAHLEAAG